MIVYEMLFNAAEKAKQVWYDLSDQIPVANSLVQEMKVDITHFAQTWLASNPIEVQPDIDLSGPI